VGLSVVVVAVVVAVAAVDGEVEVEAEVESEVEVEVEVEVGDVEVLGVVLVSDGPQLCVFGAVTVTPGSVTVTVLTGPASVIVWAGWVLVTVFVPP
jgi:hypothetical protein